MPSFLLQKQTIWSFLDKFVNGLSPNFTDVVILTDKTFQDLALLRDAGFDSINFTAILDLVMSFILLGSLPSVVCLPVCLPQYFPVCMSISFPVSHFSVCPTHQPVSCLFASHTCLLVCLFALFRTPACLSVCLHTPACLSVCLPSHTSLPVCLFAFTHQPACLSVCLTHQLACLSGVPSHQPACLSVYLKNKRPDCLFALTPSCLSVYLLSHQPAFLSVCPAH